ncbi:MAG: hypothetical protein O3A80_04000 [bacterium]|nr:hypothetical protein [bacterium]MDA1292330.1 hypothetical protein [bacterium]
MVERNIESNGMRDHFSELELRSYLAGICRKDVRTRIDQEVQRNPYGDVSLYIKKFHEDVLIAMISSGFYI